MKKNNGFLGNLQKSTKVTLLSCMSFIALTLLILIFFILFPITPSERIMASIGRENVSNNNQNNNADTALGIVTTAKATSETVNTGIIEEETGTRPAKTYKIVITTGSGFLWNGRIPAGIDDTKTTVVISDDPEYPVADPGYAYPVYTQPATEEEPEYPEDPNVTTPANPENPDYPAGTEYPVATEPPVDPNIPPVTDAPVPVDPVTPDPPPQTQPPVIIDPPQPPVDPVTPPEPNGEGDVVSEW